MSHTALSSEEPVFVCGVPKSGTTLVGQLLSNHPDFQTDFDIDPSIEFLKYVESTMNDFFFFSENSGTILGDRDKYWKDNDYAEWHLLNIKYFQGLHLSYRRGATRWGSSSCLTYLYRYMLWRWFPKATFLMVMRDPRDQWCSFRKLHMRAGIPNAWDHFLNYRGSTIPYRVDTPRFKFIEYHEVVYNPTIVFDTLGLCVPENYLNGVRDIFIGRTKGNQQEMTVELRSGQDMITSRIGRWKRDLNTDEIAKCLQAFPAECAYYDSLDL
jgi:hypothetical protein